LKIIDVNTKNISTLYATEKDEEIYPVSWLPGSSELFVQYFKNTGYSSETYLSLMNTTTSNINHLKKFHTPYMTNLSVSADRKFIAFDFPNPDDGNFNINIITKDNKNEHTVIQHPANDRVLGWIPESNKFLFVSDRTGTFDVYAMEIVKGKPVSEPVKIITDIGKISPISFTQNGALFYNNSHRNFNAFSAPIKANGKISMNERNHLLGPVFDVTWLPDGKNLVCMKYEVTNSYKPCLYNSLKNEFRPLVKNQNINSNGPLRLSPDGKSVLFFGSEKGKEKGQLYQVDIETGIASSVKTFNESEYLMRAFEWDNNGENIFYINNNSIIKYNTQTGEEKTVYTGKKISDQSEILKLHNGKHLIFVEQENEKEELVKSMSLESGKVKTICKIDKKYSGFGFRKLVYFPAAEDFYFSVRKEKGSILYRINEEGGEPEKLWETDKQITGLSIHPNHDKLTVSVFDQELEIRKIENLKQEIEKIYAEKE